MSMDGRRHSVTSPDGTPIGLLTAGQGPPLLLVHGGMGRLERWAPMWGHLTGHWQVTAMDRRGRGSSGDHQPYAAAREHEDIAAVAGHLARDAGGSVAAFGHSIGATFTLGAAAAGAPLRRIVLYEPPGPAAAPAPWRERVAALIAAGKPGPAMISFLTEIIGLSQDQVAALRQNVPGGYDVRPIVSATMVRESEVVAGTDLIALAASVTIPALLLVGEQSPPWARDETARLAAALPQATVATLPATAHDALDTHQDLITGLLREFFG
jgi:pimeloyl-ACP methyl ester carboxylesterase